MKIAMLVNNMDVSGGYHKLVIRLAQNLEKKGHHVVVYTLSVDRKNCYPADIKTINVKPLPARYSKDSQNQKWAHLAKNIPRDIDALIVHDPMSLCAVAQAEFPKKKIVWMLNNQFSPGDFGITNRFESFRSIFRRKVYLPEELKLLRQGLDKVTDFVTYDDFNKKLIKRYLNKSATVVYAGADLERFEHYANKRDFSSKKTYIFLSVGVVFPHRRYEDLIKATPALKKMGFAFRIIIVGRQDMHDEYVNQLFSLVKEEGVEDLIEFKNYVSDKEMIELYKRSDAFLFVNDGFTWGISVFEAVAAKLPVIITNNIGAADLIQNSKTGWVVEPRQPIQVAKALGDIVRNRKKAQKITETAYDKLINFLSWEAYTDRMLRVIEDK